MNSIFLNRIIRALSFPQFSIPFKFMDFFSQQRIFKIIFCDILLGKSPFSKKIEKKKTDTKKLKYIVIGPASNWSILTFWGPYQPILTSPKPSRFLPSPLPAVVVSPACLLLPVFRLLSFSLIFSAHLRLHLVPTSASGLPLPSWSGRGKFSVSSLCKFCRLYFYALFS